MTSKKVLLDAFTDRTSAICHWLKRSYKIEQQWSEKATRIYLESQGDAILARTVLASDVRRHFLVDKPSEETVERWNEGHTEIDKILVTPPKISESNAAYVDWLYVADYLLLCCGSTRDEFDQVNSVRQGQFRSLLQSYFLRQFVIDAIGLIEREAGISDEDIVKRLKSLATDEDIQPSLASVKEARRWLKDGVNPKAVVRPEMPREIAIYQAIYFH